MSPGNVAPLVGPTLGTPGFEAGDDAVASPGLFTSTDDLCLFGVGVGPFRSSLPFGADLLLSGARSDFASTFGEIGG